MFPILLAFALAAAADEPSLPAVPGEPVGEAVQTPLPPTTPEGWIAAVDARAERLTGIRYSILRTTERGEVRTEERWRFVMADLQRFRIDYFGDTARQITCDGTVLVDYVPANRMAMRFSLSKMEAAERVALVERILEKVTVPGFRIGKAEGVTWKFAEEGEIDGRPAVFLDGAGEAGRGLKYAIDTERLALLRAEFVEGGTVVLRIDSRDHREIAPGVWFPHEVRMRASSDGGEIRSSLRLTKVSTVEDAPDELFQTLLDASIPIEEVP